MPSHLVFTVFVFLVARNLVSAFPRFTIRRDCDSLFCLPSLPEFIDGAGAAWNGGVEAVDAGIGATGALLGWTINQATGLLEPPATGESTTPNIDDTNINALIQAPTPIPTPTVDIELHVVEPLWKDGQCDSASAPLPDLNSNLGITSSQDCDKATAQIVWSVSCENTEDNARTKEILSGMDAGVLESIDPTCAIEGGTSFWVLHLTFNQIEELKTEQMQSVRAVVANAPIEAYGIPLSPDLMRRDKKVSLAEKKGRYDKRDTVTKQRGIRDVPRLRFISSQKKQNAMSYAYFLPAGAGITVYVIDSGLNPFNNEFQDGPFIEWLFALGSDTTYTDSLPTSHGTCMASLITGKVYGVSKKADLVAVKISQDVASFINALAKVVEHVRQKQDSGEKVRGYTVVSISRGFSAVIASEESREEIEKYIKELTEKYQVVMVAASGQNFQSSLVYPDVSTWPAQLSLTTNIITVGAVRVTDGADNGQRFEWSSGGNALTTSAPGEGDCAIRQARNAFGSFHGTSVAAATVSGLVAYFLSLPVGDQLRGFSNIPEAVRDYVVHQSYPRFEEEEAVSNGLDGDSDKTEWSHWFGVSTDN